MKKKMKMKIKLQHILLNLMNHLNIIEQYEKRTTSISQFDVSLCFRYLHLNQNILLIEFSKEINFE